jgi:hypothetical protein
VVGEGSGVEEEDKEVEDLVAMMVILDLRRHIPDTPISVLPRRHQAGGQASGLAQWAVLQQAMRWEEEARGMVRHSAADGWARDMMTTVILGKAV